MQPPQAPPPAPKKSNVLLWILLGLVGLILIVVIGVVATGYFVMNKVKEVASNPTSAIVKMMAATNPDVEVMDYDDKTGTIKIKDKKTGKVTEVNFEDAKQGKFTVREEGGTEGTVSFSATGGSPPPDWVPVYKGATQLSNMSAKTADGDNGTIAFSIDAQPKDVAEFYREQLKANGFGISAEFSGGGGSMVTAENKEKGQTIHVVIGGEGGKTTLSVTFQEKKN